MMALPITDLYVYDITDGTTRISMLGNYHGFKTLQYKPGIVSPKNDGIWSDSPVVEGRKLISRVYGNAVDELTLRITAANIDTIAHYTKQLRRLLEKATTYWTNPNSTEPVWIRKRGSGETNMLYAYIVDWRAAGDGNPFSIPMIGNPSINEGFTLLLEHSMWQDIEPGSDPTRVKIRTTLDAFNLEGIGDSDCMHTISEYAEVMSYNRHATYIDPTSPTGVTVQVPTATISNNGAFNPKIGYDFEEHIYKLYIRVPITAYSAYDGDDFGGDYISSASFQLQYVSASDAFSGIIKVSIIDEVNCRSFAFAGANGADAATKLSSLPLGPSVRMLGSQYTYDTYTYMRTADLYPLIRYIIEKPEYKAARDAGSVYIGFVLETNVDRVYDEYAPNVGIVNMQTPAKTSSLHVLNRFDNSLVPKYSHGHVFGDSNDHYVANYHSRQQPSLVWKYDASGGTYTQIQGSAEDVNVYPVPADSGDAIDVFWHADGGGSALDKDLVFMIYDHDRINSVIIGATYYYFTDSVTLVEGSDVTDFSQFRNGMNIMRFACSIPGIPQVTRNINGVDYTGWHIRLVIYARFASLPTSVVEKFSVHRLYSINKPYIEITQHSADYEQIAGDVPALAMLKLENTLDALASYTLYPTKINAYMYPTHIVVGLRSLDRGVDFTPFLGIGSEATLPNSHSAYNVLSYMDKGYMYWITANLDTTYFDASSGIQLTSMTASGCYAYRIISANASVYPMSKIFSFILDSNVYTGTFRAYVRYYIYGDDAPVNPSKYKFRIGYGSYSQDILNDTMQYTDDVVISTFDADLPTEDMSNYYSLWCGVPMITDMGIIKLSKQSDMGVYEVALYVQKEEAVQSTIYISEIILMPVDEFACNVEASADTPIVGGYYSPPGRALLPGTSMILDSISDPRRQLVATHLANTGAQSYEWNVTATSPLILQANKDQRLWILSMVYSKLDPEVTDQAAMLSNYEILLRAELYKCQRYINMRGDE